MNYKVTATRCRPQNFSSLVGQKFVSNALSHSISKGNIAHAYLFCGPRGVGKTSSARILAKSLNCENGPTPNPCNTCPTCISITQGNSLDVIEIDGASHTGVSDVREIKEELLFQPNLNRYKIYIIDEVHMLSINAFNALLKTIEEPPPYIIFIFATTESHKIPATIRSRCQCYNFRLIDVTEINESLKIAAEEMDIETEEEALFWIAKESGGSLRDAYTLLDQIAAYSQGKITFEKIKQRMGLISVEELHNIMHAIKNENLAEALTQLNILIETGINIEKILFSFAEYLRTLMLIKIGVTHEKILGYNWTLFSKDVVQNYSLPQIQQAFSWLLQLYRDIRYSINPQFELELFLAKLAQLRLWISPSTLLEEVKTLHEQIAQGNPQSKLQEQFPISQYKENIENSDPKILPDSKLKLEPNLIKPDNFNLKKNESSTDFKTILNEDSIFQEQKKFCNSPDFKKTTIQSQNNHDNTDTENRDLRVDVNTESLTLENYDFLKLKEQENKITLLKNYFEGEEDKES